MKKAVRLTNLNKPTPVEVLIHGYYGDRLGYGAKKLEATGAAPSTVQRYATEGEVGIWFPKENALQVLAEDGKSFLQKQIYMNSVNSEPLSPLSPLAAKRLKKKFDTVKGEHPELRLQRYAGFYLGADPEIFVFDSKDELMPAWTFLPSKEAALTKHDTYTNTLYYDGPQAEFTIEARMCLNQVGIGIKEGLLGVLEEARKKDPKAYLSTQGVVEMSPVLLEKAPLKYLELGCAPSKNAYDDSPRIQIGNPRYLPLRFAGSHMHFSLNTPSLDRKGVVKGLDKILGVVMTSLFEGMEDPRRRQYYGMPGEYRTTSYGVEYRVPPSAMLAHPVLVHICYEIARQAIYCTEQGLTPYWKCKEKEAREIIKDSDVKAARKVLTRNKAFTEALLRVPMRGYYGAMNRVEKQINKALYMIFNGAKKEIDPKQVEKNWMTSSHNIGSLTS